MKCEIITGNMPQLWEELLLQLQEQKYPSKSIRHYREAMGRVDRYMRENKISEYTEAVGDAYLATHELEPPRMQTIRRIENANVRLAD